MESAYLEEERRQRDTAEAARREQEEHQRSVKQSRAKQEQVFEITISAITFFTLPFILVSGIFGMNLKNLPVDVNFWSLLVGTLVISILLLGALMAIRFILIRVSAANIQKVNQRHVAA